MVRLDRSKNISNSRQMGFQTGPLLAELPKKPVDQSFSVRSIDNVGVFERQHTSQKVQSSKRNSSHFVQDVLQSGIKSREGYHHPL